MQSWTVAAFAAVLALAVIVLIKLTGTNAPGRPTSMPVASELHTGQSAATLLLGPVVPPPPPSLAMDLDAGIELPLDESPSHAGSGNVLPTGANAPALPNGAPRSVSFGAVLVEYAGAQGAARGARSREDALALAKKLAERAKADFSAAVLAGDKGSGEDFGSVPRSVFEPGPEFVLFNLKVGEVSEPVDSPRGFYIFKRIE